MNPLSITNLSPAELRPSRRNSRTHSPKQIQQIAESIKRFGFNNPVLLDDAGEIIAGHGRVEAARLLELPSVPTVRLSHLSEAEVRAYRIADNRLAELAGWDEELLALEFGELLELDLDFDLSITGFEFGQIDALLSEDGKAEDPLDAAPIVDRQAPPVTRAGDLWRIGPHRLFCGDATELLSYERLLGGEKAQLVFTDPPYNVPIDGHVCGLGSVKHREFAMASGEMSSPEFSRFLEGVFRNLAGSSADGAIQFVCMDWRHMPEILGAGGSAFTELKNLCVWAKTNGGMGSLYRSQHELVFVFKSGSGKHINNVELGRHGRYRTNVWTYAGINSFGAGRDVDLADHPTVKPVALVADAILDCSRPNGIVLDPFAGSGTTLLAAHKTRRRGFGIELDPAYCDVVLKRMAAAGLEPVEESSGLTFCELRERRGGAGPVDEAASIE